MCLLAAAHKLMREHQIVHLPVIDGGRTVGLVSERDLAIVEAIPGVNPTTVRVEEGRWSRTCSRSNRTRPSATSPSIIARKLGSAVVVDGQDVVGASTTVDALVALRELLERR